MDGGNVVVVPAAFEDEGGGASAKVVAVTAGARVPAVVDPSPPMKLYPCEALAFFLCVPNTPIPVIIDMPITKIKPGIALAELFRCRYENCVMWLDMPTKEILLSLAPRNPAMSMGMSLC